MKPNINVVPRLSHKFMAPKCYFGMKTYSNERFDSEMPELLGGENRHKANLLCNMVNEAILYSDDDQKKKDKEDHYVSFNKSQKQASQLRK